MRLKSQVEQQIKDFHIAKKRKQISNTDFDIGYYTGALTALEWVLESRTSAYNSFADTIIDRCSEPKDHLAGE